MVLRESGIGLLATFASSSVLQSMLYKTGTRNPVVLTCACMVYFLIGILAAYMPARRAASVQPTQALKAE
jgi:ABC-type antimicrobial peptide transport system permease subunit